jgi:GDP-L-fucose synthase
VGGVLAHRLSAHYEIITPTSRDLDLTNAHEVDSWFEFNPVDAVINCAASTNFNENQFDVHEFNRNIAIVTNLTLAQQYFGRLINFGSGAEFDRKQNIFLANETQLWTTMPTDHYGLSKNITSRIVNGIQHWYNLRLFGVFGPTERPTRLLKKVIQGDPLDVMDRLFDYFYVEDIVPVVRYYLEETVPTYKDINLTYRHIEKSLSKFVDTFCEIHSIPNPVTITGKDLNHCYTGDGNKLHSLQLPLKGLIQGLQEYK